MRRRARLLLIAAAAAAPLTALANGVSLPETIGVSMRAGNATELGLEANFGWLSAPDGVHWTWVCHGIILEPTSQLTPYFYPGQDATMVTARSLGVTLSPEYSSFRSVDGCDWDPATDLANVNVREFAWDPVTPDHVLAATFTGSGATNGIWESNDAGATWTQTTLDMAERFFRSVRFSQADPQRVYASATWFQPQPSAWIYVSNNGGDDWTETPWTFEVGGTLQSNVDIIATSPTNADIAYARTNGGIDYLLRTSDGGVSWHKVFEVADDIRGVTHDGATAVWVGTVLQGTWRAPDGMTFTRLPDVGRCPGSQPCPSTRGLAYDSRGVFVAGSNYVDEFALGLTTDSGGSYTRLFQYADLEGPRVCPASSDVTTICGPQWPAIQQLLGQVTPSPTPSPPAGDDDDGGGGPICTCSFTNGTPAALPACAAMLLLAIAALRRRRT